ncbi:P-loop containing nucleoside triphosphate hydrolase protein [Phyllosticta citriasiana]|uniref:RNA helicase n=1 Tax=Phyllosticta citriasiana TaxID=595635 RepID=A0ABR1KER6_9PEZI
MGKRTRNESTITDGHPEPKKTRTETGDSASDVLSQEVNGATIEKKKKPDKSDKPKKSSKSDKKDSKTSKKSNTLREPKEEKYKRAKESSEQKKLEKQSRTEAGEAQDAETSAKKAKKEAKRAAKEVKESTEKDAEAEKKAKKAEKAARKAAKKSAKKTDEDTVMEDAPVKANGEASSASSEDVPKPSAALNGESTSGYVEAAALSALPQPEIDAFLSKHFITITDPLKTAAKFRPIISFAHLPITDESLRAPFASFSAPTPIQAAAWPALFAGRDMIGVAETGSGKTLGFGVPCVRHITSLPKKDQRGIKAVIVSPTRELACQIHEQIEKLAGPAGLKTVCVYGGVPKDDQRAALKKATILVATPGRLNDFIDEGAADISKADFVVLDEADRMLDKGFEDAIKKIISSTRPLNERQTLMFTATWPKSVQELAATFMRSPVKIMIGENTSGELRANTRIAQTVEVIEPWAKENRLIQLLKQNQSGSKKNDRILVFALYKKEATRIENLIRNKGFRVAGIHGDLGQAQRTASLEKFKKGEVSLLVATDVAARGLDIPDVKVVVNNTFPLTAEDYVHRIGRTGRAGADGKSITLFTEHDKALAGALVNVLKGANQPVPDELLKFGTTVKKKGHDAYGAFYKDPTDMKAATKITFDD